MTDIFREVDEDIRRDQLKKLWERFGPYVILLAVLIVAATAGYRGWEYWQQSRAQASGDRYLAALKLSADGKHPEAIAAYQEIVKDGSGSYPLLARFRIATEKSESGDTAGAVADFDSIAADGSVPDDIQTLARIRAALLLVDTATLDDLQKRVGDLAETGNQWRHTAREILGLAAWRTGDYAASRKYFQDIVNDQESSTELRQRSQLMLNLIDAQLGPQAPETPPAADASAPDASATDSPGATDAPAATDTPTPDAPPAN